jgi:hypothetical protein
MNKSKEDLYMRKLKELFKKREWILDDRLIDGDGHRHMHAKCGNFFEFVIALFIHM